jgi:hypothetical protein
MEQVWDTLIGGEFNPFGVYEQKADFIRGGSIEEAYGNGVEANAFSRAGGTSDEQMGHSGEIGDHRLSHDIFAQG